MKILAAENSNGSSYQIVSIVDNIDEACEMARNYMTYGPKRDLLRPDRFVVISRDQNGNYTRREVLTDADILDGDQPQPTSRAYRGTVWNSKGRAVKVTIPDREN